MKIGDRFIAERFETNDEVIFNSEMKKYTGRQCEIIRIPKESFAIVEFDDENTWTWLKSALKPIKSNGFYIGQKVYSHLFPTHDCSGVISVISYDKVSYPIQVISGNFYETFTIDGRRSDNGGICLFDEPIERPKPKITFEYGELVWASDYDFHWRPSFFVGKTNGRYDVAFVKANDGELSFFDSYNNIKKYE